MSYSDVQICNRALMEIGDTSIINLSDGTEKAKACRLCYEDMRDALLADHPWLFAMKRASLGGALATASAFGFDYAYQLPTDCLTIRNVYGSGLDEFTYTQDAWTREGETILTDEEAPIYLRYVQRIEDPQKFPPPFVEALVFLIASKLAGIIVRSNPLVERMTVMHEQKLKKARHLSAIEQAPIATSRPGDWELARR